MSRVGRVFCALAISLVSTDTVTRTVVTWRPNTSFNLPIYFEEGKIPCGREKVLFPVNLISGVKISSVNDVESLILPVNGELLLTDKATINFGPSKETAGDECTTGERHFTDAYRSAWLRADSWEATTFNAATPDAQRVPCFNDDVVFPEDSQFAIQLPDVTQYVRSISIGGNKINARRFFEIVETGEDPSQSFILNSALTTGVKIRQGSCESRAGCPCQANATIVDCATKSCEIPTCKDPVRPEGHCCFICGGVLKFEIDVNIFNLNEFKKYVKDTVTRFGGPDKIIYHIGLLRKGKVQVVMVDNGEYEGNSALAIYSLGNNMDMRAVNGLKQRFISGTPINKAGVAGEVVGLCLLLAVLVFTSVYIWFYKSYSSVSLPHIPFPSSNVFFRFENRENSITSLTSRRSVSFGTSFRNPLYNTQRGKSPATSEDVAGEETPAEPRRDLEDITRMSSLLPDDD